MTNKYQLRYDKTSAKSLGENLRTYFERSSSGRETGVVERVINEQIEAEKSSSDSGNFTGSGLEFCSSE